MTYVDEMIGRILNLLEVLKLDRDTVIVFTSDHGDMLGERGMWFKKTMFENTVHIPLFLFAPTLKPGRVRENVSLVDLLPTFLEIADPDGHVKPVCPLDGRSLLALADGSDSGWPDTIYSEINCEGVIEPVVMVRKGRVSRVSPVQTALRNCTGDEGGPFGFGDQELIPSYRKLLWSKAMVVSVAEKSGR